MNWFALCPDVIPLFQKDMSRHGTMLVTMLETAVTLLTDLIQPREFSMKRTYFFIPKTGIKARDIQ